VGRSGGGTWCRSWETRKYQQHKKVDACDRKKTKEKKTTSQGNKFEKKKRKKEGESTQTRGLRDKKKTDGISEEDTNERGWNRTRENINSLSPVLHPLTS